MSDSMFVINVLKLVAEYDLCGMLWWRCDDEYAPITFFINCNDLFWWASGDCERITEENLSVLEQTIKDCEAIDNVTGAILACELFCARIRHMRPQGAAYPDNKELWPLYDACGPERKLDAANPCKPGEYK